MALDKRLFDAAIDLLNRKHPSLVSISELYIHVEENVDFDKHQLMIHKQIAGQAELNWKHDLRNLLGTAKSNGQIINPCRTFWGLPLISSDVNLDMDTKYDQMVKRASLAVRNQESFSCLRTLRNFSITRYSADNIEIFDHGSTKPYNLPKGMVISKLRHIINCGGLLELGLLHKWSIIESAIIHLCEAVTIIDSKVVWIETL